MNFELYTWWTYVIVAMYAVMTITALLLIGVGVDFVRTNHRTRLERHESIPTYYRHLLAH